MTTLLDEIEGQTRLRIILAVVLGVPALALGIVKVRNELKMTEAYDRQAVALENIAASMPGLNTDERIKKVAEIKLTQMASKYAKPGTKPKVVCPPYDLDPNGACENARGQSIRCDRTCTTTMEATEQ